MAMRIVEADEEAPPEATERTSNDDNDDTEGADEEDDDEESVGISLGEHWNFYLLLILGGSALMLGQRMTWACDIVNRNIHFSTGYNATTFCESQNFTSFQQTTCETFFHQHACGFKMWSGADEDDRVCLSYNQFVPPNSWLTPSFDAFFRTAELSSVMANIAGAFPFFIMICILCFPIIGQQVQQQRGRMKGGLLRWLFLAAFLCQCMTFWILASNVCNGVGFFQQYYLPGVDLDSLPLDKVQCSLAGGGKMSVAATVLYFLCFCLAPLAVPPPPVRMDGGYYQEQESSSTPQAPEEQATTATGQMSHQLIKPQPVLA